MLQFRVSHRISFHTIPYPGVMLSSLYLIHPLVTKRVRVPVFGLKAYEDDIFVPSRGIAGHLLGYRGSVGTS